MQTTLEEFCLSQGLNRTYWIAYSGGMDSHVLLHLFSQLRQTHPLRLRAVYVNHGLSQNAGAWAAHCKKVCEDLQIDFTEQKIQAKSATGESPEEIARERRYQVFSTLLAKDDYLVTAHHEDDQAETLLIQLFRGAGPKGLSAMPVIKVLGEGQQVRPLLNFTRDDFHAYAVSQKLSWIEDESNTNLQFSRNFIRHKIMPVLKERWPSVTHTLSRVSQNCAEAQLIVEEQALQDYETVQGSQPLRLSLAGLKQLNSLRQRQVLRLWFMRSDLGAPSASTLHQIQADILQARGDKTPHLAWNGLEIRRFRDDLYAIPALSEHDPDQVHHWDLSAPLQLAGWQYPLRATLTQNQGLKAEIKAITVRFRQGGETCRLPGRNCSHSLKKLFQDWQIPHWERDRVPLLYVGEKLVSVVGFFIDEEYEVKNEAGYVIS